MAKDSMAKDERVKDESAKEKIVAAIRRAAEELGRAPSRGELRRITGVSHYRVLAEFRTLREAVRAAGLEPNPKGEKISTEDLLADWKRVGRKLGRRPSRAEYVREGKYSAGALTVRFGSWGRIGEKSSTTEVTEEHREREEETVSREASIRRTWPRTRIRKTAQERVTESNDPIAMRWARPPLAPLPLPLVGMRRVTEEVAQLVVNTLLGSGGRSGDLVIGRSGHLRTNAATTASLNDEGTQSGSGDRLAPRGIRKDRAVMGAPFDASPMTNAPVNELGVMVLFGMVAAALGLQVESVQGKFPDCVAKREVAPGKWQYLRIEFEYESKNFHLHGHDPKGCDVIVCWRHNWRECPAEIEVIELSRIVGKA
jgi:Homing endonuclease associated repeat